MPISLETVRALARLLPEADLSEITIDSGDFASVSADVAAMESVHLTLRRASAAAPRPAKTISSPATPTGNSVAETAAPVNSEIAVVSPAVGIFRPARTPLQIDDAVKIGQVVGVVESLKVPSEVKAQATGRVRSVLAEDGQGVEYGQPLFLLESTS